MKTSTLSHSPVFSLGLDVSSPWFDVAAHPSGLPKAQVRRLCTRRYERTPEGARLLQQWILERQSRGEVFRELVMESTGRYSSQLATWLREAGCTVPIAIVNAREITDHAGSLGMRTKSDRMDACVIASYASRMQPDPTPPEPQVYADLTTLSHQRQRLVETRQALGNQLSDLRMADTSPTVTSVLLEALDAPMVALDEQIAKLDKAMEALAASDKGLAADLEVVRSVPGVGPVVSMGVLADLGDLRLYGTSGGLVCFVGLCPKTKESGTSVKGRGFMSKQGSAHVRRLLYLAAMAAIKGNNSFRGDYEALVARGKNKRAALGALMRKILRVMRAVIISGRPYDDGQRLRDRAKRSGSNNSPAATAKV